MSVVRSTRPGPLASACVVLTMPLLLLAAGPVGPANADDSVSSTSVASSASTDTDPSVGEEATTSSSSTGEEATGSTTTDSSEPDASTTEAGQTSTDPEPTSSSGPESDPGTGSEVGPETTDTTQDQAATTSSGPVTESDPDPGSDPTIDPDPTVDSVEAESTTTPEASQPSTTPKPRPPKSRTRPQVAGPSPLPRVHFRRNNGSVDSVSIGGTVTDGRGEPEAAIKATAYFADPAGEPGFELFSEYTNADGDYRFRGLAAGCYVIELEAPSERAFDRGAFRSRHRTCVDPGQWDDSIDDVLFEPGPEEPFTLNILHLNDHRSGLLPESRELTIDGIRTEVEFGGMDRVVAKILEREAELGSDHVVKIHAGGALGSNPFATVFSGAADAALMNQACFDVVGASRHRLEPGQDRQLGVFLDFLADGRCRADLVARAEAAYSDGGLAVDKTDQMILPFTVQRFDRHLVGFVGLDAVPVGAEPSSVEAEVAAVQSDIDQLTERGVGNIVLVSHRGLPADVDLVAQLSGVDVVVGGGSADLLGDFHRFGLDPVGPYPLRAPDAEGNEVCVVHAWHNGWVVGELAVGFDGEGGVESCDGTPHLLIGDTFLVPNAEARPDGETVPLDAASRDRVDTMVDANPELAIVVPDPSARETIKAYAQALDSLAQQPVAEVGQVLCDERVPGAGRSLLCPASTTTEHGGDTQQLLADALLARAGEADIAISHAGAVTGGLQVGPLTVDEVYGLLGEQPRSLVYVDLTGAEIATTIEQAVEAVFAGDGWTGAYPYSAGLRWRVDLSLPGGRGVTGFEVLMTEPGPGGLRVWEPLDHDRTYRVITTTDLLGQAPTGTGGYPTLAAAADEGRSIDTHVDPIQVVLDYLRHDLDGRVTKPAAWRYSTRSFVPPN